MVQTVRLTDLPRVLVGPMLRRVDPASVSVFFALRAPATVSVRIFGADPQGEFTTIAVGTRATVELAEHLHVVTVTAVGDTLTPGTTYYYQAYFGVYADDGVPVPEDGDTLYSPGIYVAEADPDRARTATEEALLYPAEVSTPPSLPSFATPPADLNHLRIFHASCRKPHGGGFDMLGQLDRIIGPAVGEPQKRPHQLLLTGDQIYADDVADGLLAVIGANAKLLGFVEEPLPDKAGTGTLTPDQLKPGGRQKLMEDEAGFTSDEAKSHLMSFAEYAVMYLMVWSDLLWPAQLPAFADIYPDEAAILSIEESPWNASTYNPVGVPTSTLEEKMRAGFNGQIDSITQFSAGLPAVRRAMAHVPVLTICDDHDVTDDWNMTLKWCQQAVLPTGSKLGRRVVTDAMLAYAYFQAWGNTPEQFSPTGAAGAPGRDLIAHTKQWNRGADTHYTALGDLLALPSGITTTTVDGITTKSLTRPAGALDYHYFLTWANYQLILLDTRTHRSYLGGPDDPPALLWTDDALDAMLDAPPDLGPNAATVIVSPAVAIGLPLMEETVQPKAAIYNIYYADLESWSGSVAAYHKFLARCLKPGATDSGGTVRRNVVLLSGDVHYGFAASVHYRASKPFASGDAPMSGTIAQLVSSSLHNEETKTRLLHKLGYDPFFDRVPHRGLAGWTNSTGSAFTIGLEFKTVLTPLPVPYAVPLRVRGTPAVARVDQGWLTADPEWYVSIDYLKQYATDPAERPRQGDPIWVTNPNSPPEQALAQYITASSNYQSYLGQWGTGKEIVGVDNFGEVTFQWSDSAAYAGRRRVIQTLWWRLPGEPDAGGASPAAGPLTRYVAELDGIPPAMAAKFPAPSAYEGSNLRSLADTDNADDADEIVPAYDGFILRDGDHDGAPPRYDGAARPNAADGHVAQLQADLLELGFGLVGTADGAFGRWTRWAVREFQTYAKGTHVALDNQPNPRPARYSESLQQAELPEADRYAGPVSGVVDYDTAAAIQSWKEHHWRCPVVIEAWDMASGQPSSIHQIPASGGNPARGADNIWRYDDVQSTGPRVYAVDLSGRYDVPESHIADAPAHPELQALGEWTTLSQWSVTWSGGAALPPRHTWPEGEMLPERMLPVIAGTTEGPTIAQLVAARAAAGSSQADRDFAARQLSTYKVVRSVAEVEALGHFDVYNSYDTAFLSCGPCHWTAGPTAQGTDPGDSQDWVVDDGELWGYFAYLQSADPAAYQQMTADYGLGVDRSWGLDGTALWDSRQRKYVAAPTLTDEHGAATVMPKVVREYDLFRNWHWSYRIAMAGRAGNYSGWRRGMWAMARQRINDIARAPWNVSGSFHVADIPLPNGGHRQARIGDVFTSERAMAMVLRWHVLSPAGAVSRGRSGSRLRGALTRAMTAAAALDWSGSPDTWTDAHETALIDGISAEAAAVGGFMSTSIPRARDWPTWSTTSNPQEFSLPLGDLPAAERHLLANRGSLLFDGSALTHGV